MVFRRSNNSLRPINSRKHIIDAQGVLVAGTQQSVVLATCTDNPVLANVTEVETGSKINALYLNIQVRGTAAAGVLGNVYMYIVKNPGANISAFPNGNVVGASDKKRQVFHQEMRMLSDGADSIPVQLFTGVLKVPRVFRTMRIDDDITLFLFSPSGSEFCVQSVYKEYR